MALDTFTTHQYSTTGTVVTVTEGTLPTVYRSIRVETPENRWEPWYTLPQWVAQHLTNIPEGAEVTVFSRETYRNAGGVKSEGTTTMVALDSWVEVLNVPVLSSEFTPEFILANEYAVETGLAYEHNIVVANLGYGVLVLRCVDNFTAVYQLRRFLSSYKAILPDPVAHKPFATLEAAVEAGIPVSIQMHRSMQGVK